MRDGGIERAREEAPELEGDGDGRKETRRTNRGERGTQRERERDKRVLIRKIRSRLLSSVLGHLIATEIIVWPVQSDETAPLCTGDKEISSRVPGGSRCRHLADPDRVSAPLAFVVQPGCGVRAPVCARRSRLVKVNGC